MNHSLESIDSSARLLGPDEPLPFEIVNADGSANLLLVCDHASRRIPRALGDLGLDARHFDRHIAYDIGVEAVTRNLSRDLDAAAVLAGYSRLVFDVNRPPGHPESILEVSEDTEIPGNRNLSEREKEQRVSELHDPYHEAVGHTLAHIWNRGPAPALFSVHSFTPNYRNEDRPWDVGILWKRDPRIAVPMMEKFRARGMNVGDNEPYSGHHLAYTVDVHGGAAGLANCVLEIRQDQVATPEGIEYWSRVLAEDLGAILEHDGINQVAEY